MTAYVCSPNPFGGRVRTAAHRQAEAQAEAFSGLPPGSDRFTVIRLLRQAGRELGWQGRLIDHLELLTGLTRDQDWTPGGRPVVWLSVRETALRLQITERQVRRNEKRMMELGAVAFNDSANCRRFGWRDESGRIVEAYGVDLSPGASLIPELTLRLHRLTEDREAHHRLRRRISASRRRIRAALADAAGREEAGQAADAIETMIAGPAAVHDGSDLSGMEREAERLEEIDRRLTALLDGGDPEPASGGVKNVRPAGRQCPPGQTSVSAPQYKDSESQKEKDNRRGRSPPNRAEPDAAAVLARMPELVAAALPPNRAAGWAEIIEAARSACRLLGVSPDAWGQACRILGRKGAALAVIVIAAKQDKIHSPGGYLRAMTGRRKDGRLKLRPTLNKLFPPS